jgi:hypothetical protein
VSRPAAFARIVIPVSSEATTVSGRASIGWIATARSMVSSSLRLARAADQPPVGSPRET